VFKGPPHVIINTIILLEFETR